MKRRQGFGSTGGAHEVVQFGLDVNYCGPVMDKSRATRNQPDRPVIGIAFIILAMMAISVNDTLMKLLTADYALHQLVFIRSLVAIVLTVLILRFEGGWASLKTEMPWLHLLRGLLIVFSNLCFFAGLAALPLAQATALFFVAPLLITLLSVFILGEQAGPYRFAAVGMGLAGVLVILQPWQGAHVRDQEIWVLLLPLMGAVFYALNQIVTRKLGAVSQAAAMAVYIQLTFIFVSSLFYLAIGDGRFETEVDATSLVVVLRAWRWPDQGDWFWLLVLGISSGVIGYSLSQSYRLANAATLAPFEYTGLPWAILWGWLVWNEWPDQTLWSGMALIISGGLIVIWRENRIRKRQAPGT